MSAPVAFLHASTNSFTDLPALAPIYFGEWQIYHNSMIKYVTSLEEENTFSSPNIVYSNSFRPRFLEGFDMGIHEISDIDVISYASSISCWVVCSLNL